MLTDEEYNPKPVKLSDNRTVDAQVIDIGDPSKWKVVQTPCSGGHNFVPDTTESEFEAEICTKCHIGRLIRRRAA